MIKIYQNDLDSAITNILSNSAEIAIDTETMGLKIGRDRLCLVQISSGDGNAHLVQFDSTSNYKPQNLISLLQNPKICKIFHFARFDLATIKYYLNIEVKNIYCTKIASKLARTYTDSHGLKSLCDEILGVEISKKQQSSDWGIKNLSEKQILYAASDVLYLHKIKDSLNKMLEREHKIELFNNVISFLPVRVSLDLFGFELDIFAH